MKYECHITTDFVHTDTKDHAELSRIALSHGFRVAKLYKANKSISDLDTFMTGHSDSFEQLKFRMESLVSDLKFANFTVNRYKIEEILLDSRRM